MALSRLAWRSPPTPPPVKQVVVVTVVVVVAAAMAVADAVALAATFVVEPPKLWLVRQRVLLLGEARPWSCAAPPAPCAAVRRCKWR